MTTRTSSSSILHLFLVTILVSSYIVTAATLEYDEMLMLPERKIAKRRMLRRKLGSSFKPTKVFTNKTPAAGTANVTAASGYNDTTLVATRMVQRMTPTISTGADQRRKLKRQPMRQRTIHHTQK